LGLPDITLFVYTVYVCGISKLHDYQQLLTLWLAVVVVAIPLFLVQETTLTIEYVPAIAPPDPQEPRVHDDWVSAVDGSFPRSVNFGFMQIL
jgi:hypothetical protein